MPMHSSVILLAFPGGNLRRAVKYVACAGAAAIAGLVLLGWTFGIRNLISIVPGTVPMPPMVAVVLAISSLSLWLCGGRPSRSKRNLGLVCAGCVSLAGLGQLVAYAVGTGAIIDQLLFRQALARVALDFAPTRIQTSPNSAINFVFVGVALLLAHVRWRRLKLAALF